VHTNRCFIAAAPPPPVASCIGPVLVDVNEDVLGEMCLLQVRRSARLNSAAALLDNDASLSALGGVRYALST
jgi:hypothetical protein